jgi:hypothetical protein
MFAAMSRKEDGTMREKVGLVIGLALVLVVSVATAETVKPAWCTKQFLAQMLRHNSLKSTGKRPLATGRRPGAALDGEFMIDTNTTYGHGQHDFVSIAEAFDGTNYLVVWEDYNSDVIEGARATREGVVIDSSFILIPAEPNYPATPVVAFDGTNFMVVWSDIRTDAGDIYGTRVSQAGVVLDSAGIPISTAVGEQAAPSIAWNGTNYLVVWQDHRDTLGTNDIFGAQVTPAGQVLDPGGIAISKAANDQVNPNVGFQGTDYLVTWTDSRRSQDLDIYGARVSMTGVVLDTGGIPIDTTANQKDLSKVATLTNGVPVSSLVVWQDNLLGVRGARVNDNGQVLDKAGITIRPPRENSSTGEPDVACDSTNYVVAWIETDTLTMFSTAYAARVTPSGRVLDTAGVEMSSDPSISSGPASLFDGSRYLMSWGDENAVCCVRATPDLASFDTTVISAGGSPNDEDYSGVAFDGQNFLVAWTDDRNANDDIYCARVTPSGVDLDPKGIQVMNSGMGLLPSVAFDGTDFLVAWCDGRLNDTAPAIYAARVNQSGKVLDTEGILVYTNPEGSIYPNVIYDGVNFLLTWTREDYLAFAARVSPAGKLLDTQAIVLCQTPGGQFIPTAASNDSVSLVAWSDLRSGDHSSIYGTRIDRAGRVLDSNGIRIMAATGNQEIPSVATNGHDFLVAWEDAPMESTYININCARVNAQGVVLDTFGKLIDEQVNSGFVPFVGAIFDGQNYVVVWPDTAHSVTGDIYGATVNQAGRVVDTFLVADITNNFEEIPPYLNLTRGQGMQTLCTYTAPATTWQGKNYDVDRIWGKLGAYTGVLSNSRNATPSLQLLASPNPCHSAAIIRYSLPEAARLSLKLYDVSGRAVQTVFEGRAQAGVAQLELRTQGLARGVYVLRLDAGAQHLIKKLVID